MALLTKDYQILESMRDIMQAMTVAMPDSNDQEKMEVFLLYVASLDVAKNWDSSNTADKKVLMDGIAAAKAMYENTLEDKKTSKHISHDDTRHQLHSFVRFDIDNIVVPAAPLS